VDTQRKNISVFNHVERLNKDPRLFLNYLRLLASNKGWGFTVDEEVPEGAGKAERTNYRLQAIMQAKDITSDEYDELCGRKKVGKTTTEENFQCERFFWQRFLAQKELSEDLLKEFAYDVNPLENFVGLVDARNHEREDNLRSAKFLERVETVRGLLAGLGFASCVDRGKIDRESFLKNWEEGVVGRPEFQSKRLNELWGLSKSRRIDAEMNPRQILAWVNMLMKPFGLKVKSDHGKYGLEERFDIMGLIRRKNERGRYYVDGEGLLGQVLQSEDLFIDEESGEVKRKTPRWVIEARERLDTRWLDNGIEG
jgi:hypothetical protein